jgi:hypothetical protein
MNFSYFDQFPDIEIDMSDYLKNVSNSGSPYLFTNIQPVKTNIKNLFVKFELALDFKKNIDQIQRYTINEFELPDLVSYKNFQTTDFWWIVLVFNNIRNPLRDWPVSQDQLSYLADYFYTTEGKYTRSTYYEFLFEANEAKRNIILPQPKALLDIVYAYQQEILKNEA